jgi:hypothetical protein
MNIDNQDQEAKVRAIGEILGGLLQQMDAASSTGLAAGSLAQGPTVPLAASGGLNSAANGAAASQGSGGLRASEIASSIAPAAGRSPASLVGSLLLSPIWRGLFGLFRNRGIEASAAPEPFLRAEAESTQLDANWSPAGRPRELRRDSYGRTQTVMPNQEAIQISIQALDARSILDRSEEIASAVRQAMLANHEINDSMTEL